MQIVNLVGLLTIVASLFLLDTTGWIVALFMYFLYGGVGVSITYHRHLTHRSFEFKYEWLRKLCILLGAMAGQDGPLSWVAIHGQHHKAEDTHEDPHTPLHGVVRGFILMEWTPYDLRSVARLTKDPFMKVLHDYYLVYLFLVYLILFLIGGVWLLVSAGVIPTGLSILGSNLINYFAHTWGYCTTKTKGNSKNNWLVAILTFGEGWHNNHHAKPNKHSFQNRWWEFDVGALVIRHLLADKTTLK